MKVRLLFLFLFSLLLPLLGDGLCLRASETITDLREAYKTYREYRKQAEKYGPVSVGLEDEVEVSVCASCPQIADLAGAINKTMVHMVENNQIDLKEVGALEEIERLEAMYYLVHYDMEKAKILHPDFPLEECTLYQLDVYLHRFQRDPIANERLTEIFQFNVPLNDVRALHFRSRAEKGRYYFYRAEWPHHDKIIRIHIPANSKEATVSYLQLDRLPNSEDSKFLQGLERKRRELLAQQNDKPGDEPPKIFGMEYWGGLGSYKSDKSEWEAGFAVAHKDNIPRRILLLRGKDEAAITDNLKVNTEVEVSDRDQEVRMRLNYQGQDYLRLKGEADGDFRAEIPFEIHMQEYAFTTKGSIARTESGEEAALSFFQGGSSLVHIKTQRSLDNSQTVTVGNTYEDVLGGTVSLDYQRRRNALDENGNAETIWLRYQKQF